MKKLIFCIAYIVFAFVIFRMVVNNTPVFQIEPEEPIEFVRDFVTTSPSELGAWLWKNILVPVFKTIAFPFEVSLDFLVGLGSRFINFFADLFDSDILQKISDFFADVQSFFDGFWKIFKRAPGLAGGR